MRPGFHSQLEKSYKMRLRALSGNTQLDLQEVNNWVRQQTKGRIMRFMKDMPTDVSILLAGAAYFKGKNVRYLLTEKVYYACVKRDAKERPGEAAS